ncbi:MAG: 2-dehydropantoate 2-reductase [Myxococcota bacterium]|nr:2-dehydropantoate 2-reductase [Myxococcota bacterium]
MHYGIVGIGPVGAVFAAHLKQAGHEVSAIDLNVHRQRYLSHNPLVISGELPAEAQLTDLTTDMETFVGRGPEVVLICTKSGHSIDVLKQLRSFNIDDRTVFVSAQNGIDAEDDIAAIFGEDRAYRLVVHMGCNYVRKSEVWVEFARTNFLSDKGNQISQQLFEAFNTGELKTTLTDRCKEEAFKKAVLNMSLSSICALTRLTMKEVMVEPELERMVREITRESIRVGQALGFNIGDDYLEYALSYLSQGGDHKPSMLVDIEQERITENEYHAGKLFRYAEQHGLDVPVIQTVYYLLKNLERAIVLDAYVSEGMRPKA